MIKAYLSYRRIEGELSPLAESLLEWVPPDIQLKVDCRDASVSRPLDEFLDELKTSSSVVFLLNDAYFKSPWCLGELHAFLERRNASYHGFFIACEGWLPKQDSQAFFDQLQESLVNYWQRVEAEAATDAIKEEAGIFLQDISEMIRIVRRLNLPDEKSIRENQGEQVWTRIKAQRERAKMDYQPCDGGTLREECRRQIVHRLQHSSLLCRELARHCDLELDTSAEAIIAQLWDPEVGLANNLSPLYQASQEAWYIMEPNKRDSMRLAIRDILGLALLGMLDNDDREKVLRPGHGFLDTDYLELADVRPETVELVFASAQNRKQTIPHLAYHNGSLTVAPERRYDFDKKDLGRRFSADAALDAQLRLLWNLEFPNVQKGDEEYLNEEDFRSLGRSLKKNFERGLARYFLVPQHEAANPLNRAGIISALKYRLPYLFVFRTGITDRPKMISGEFSETDLVYELTTFAKFFKPTES